MSPGPSLAEALRAAMNAARKAQDKDRTLVLGTILANLRNREIDLRRPASDDEVVDVLRTGSNDVYVVRPAQGREILLPAVDTCVREIDVAGGRLVARLPDWMT